MDGSLMENVVVELQGEVLRVSSWNEIRQVVRDWATKYQFQPCTTTPDEAGLHIAYLVGWGDDFRKAYLSIPVDDAKCYISDFEARRSGVW